MGSTPGMGRLPGEGIGCPLQYSWASLVTQMVKNLPANAGGAGSIPWSGRSPGEGNGNPLQYSCLENPTDRGALWATVLGVTRVGHDLATKPPPPLFISISSSDLAFPDQLEGIT